MDYKNYPKIFKNIKWAAIYSFVLFFVAINCVVFFLFKNTPLNYKRLHSPTSYGEIKNKIELVQRDTNKKIIFLGASAMWGAPGISDPEDTVPFQFAKKINGDVSVYSFAFPAAHPLDILLISILLKNQADLFVVDINSDYLMDDAVMGAKEDRRKYLRVYKLLSANYRKLFSESPAAEACLRQYGLNSPYEFYFDLTSYVPLLKYKDEINYLLFGKPFQQFVPTVLAASIDIFKSGMNLAALKDVFKPHDDFPVKNIQVNNKQVESLKPSINSCVSSALSEFFAKNNIPSIFYLSPHSFESTQLQRKQIQFTKNKEFVAGLYQGVFFVDLDVLQPVSTSDFLDEVHFNKNGHSALANTLFGLVENNPHAKDLFTK